MRVALKAGVLGMALWAAGAVRGQSTPEPIFNNTTRQPQGNWTDGHLLPDVSNVTDMGVRGISYWVGGGTESTWVISILFGVLVLGALGTNRAGVSAAFVAAIASGFALSTSGFLPGWVYTTVVLPLVALLLVAAWFRMSR